MIETGSLTCAFERLGGPSFEMSAEDVMHYEKVGFLKIVDPAAVNDNGEAAGTDLR